MQDTTIQALFKTILKDLSIQSMYDILAINRDVKLHQYKMKFLFFHPGLVKNRYPGEENSENIHSSCKDKLQISSGEMIPRKHKLQRECENSSLGLIETVH